MIGLAGDELDEELETILTSFDTNYVWNYGSVKEGLRDLYEKELAHYSEDVFKGFEKVRNFRFVADEFSTENDMLTPTLKLKRRNVIKAYQGLLDEMYAG